MLTDRPPAAPRFSLRRILRLSSFHIGSAMGDILLTSVWNRVMITDFGIPAWPVGLLIALRYFLSPLSLWAGHRADTQPIAGFYRTPYIWLGRALMLLSLPMLGASTVRLGADTGSLLGWTLATVACSLYGLGTLLSGSPFLALVQDAAPPQKKGLAIALVQTALIAFFPVVAFGFGRLLATYDEAAFWRLLGFAAVVSAFFWVYAILGVERRGERPGGAAGDRELADIGGTFRRIWGDSRTRRFFLFLFVATFSAWIQENVLEPFGGEVFAMPAGETTRLTAYWGTATILVLLASFVVWRRRRPERLSPVAGVGLGIMAGGMLLLIMSALGGQQAVFLLGLLVFGGGFGLYTFGGLSLMAAMSPDPHAGAYLGLWTLCTLLSKGFGTFVGGLLRDIFLALGARPALAYGLVFGVAATGLVLAVLALLPLDVPGFARDNGRLGATEELQLASLDL